MGQKNHTMDIDQKFEQIKKKYKEYYDSLLKKGELLVRDTSKGIWGVAGTDEVFDFFKQIDLGKYKQFLDIGAGDGKVVLIASLFGVSAKGIEIDKELVDVSVKIRDSLGLDCSLICGDYMEHDLSKYDIIFINPDKGFHHFEAKLEKELKGVLFVYNNIFQPRFLKKGKSYWVNQIPVIRYSND